MFSHSLTLRHALLRHHSRSVTSSFTLCHASVTLLSRSVTLIHALSRLCHAIFHALSRSVTLFHALSRSVTLQQLVFFARFSFFSRFFCFFFSVKSVTQRHATSRHAVFYTTYFFILHIHELPCLRCFFTTYFFILHMVCHANVTRPPLCFFSVFTPKCFFFSDFHSIFILFFQFSVLKLCHAACHAPCHAACHGACHAACHLGPWGRDGGGGCRLDTSVAED